MESGKIRSGVTVNAYGDSRLVVNQFNGTWRVNAAHLRGFYRHARILYAALKEKKVRAVVLWLPRKHNLADPVAHEAYVNYQEEKERVKAQAQLANYQSEFCNNHEVVLRNLVNNKRYRVSLKTGKCTCEYNHKHLATLDNI